MIKIVSKTFKSWSKEIQKELLDNTLFHGEMKMCVLRNQNTKTFVCFDNGKVCGWLAKGFIKTNKYPEKVIILFVNSYYRNKDIGKKLIASSLKNEKEQVVVLPWDTKSFSFFNKMRRIFSKLYVYDASTFFIEYGYLNAIWSAKKHI